MASLPQGDFAAVRAAVESAFPVQELWFQDGRPIFAIVPSEDDKERFLRLRRELSDFGLLPLLRRREGETLLLLMPKPEAGPTRWLLPAALFAATLVTTFIAGYLNSRGGCLPGLLTPVVGGIAFSLSLMAILFCHEMGHKIVSIRRGIDASLPMFIPMPPLPGLSIGTMGAVIFTRTPSPNRDALVELGASGPIAGFIVAVPVLIYGIQHSLVVSHAAVVSHGCQLVAVPTPLLVDLLVKWLLHPQPTADVIIHPMAFAGWVGLLVTALNLLPASMLDGGHVMRAVFGPKVHMILSYVAVGVGVVFGYWVMSLLILLMIRRGHPGPLDDCSAVTFAHKAMAAALVLIFALSAVPLTTL
jgi:Zn-dependent protease